MRVEARRMTHCIVQGAAIIGLEGAGPRNVPGSSILISALRTLHAGRCTYMEVLVTVDVETPVMELIGTRVWLPDGTMILDGIDWTVRAGE